MSIQIRELLNSLIAGEDITVQDVDQFITYKVPEDLYLEYKSASTLQDKKEACATLRQYLSGFANSDGGILILGLNQNLWKLENCIAPGGGNLNEWAARCLTPIAHLFSPPPRFQILNHPDGNILVAVIDRSLGLVQVVEEGELVYYFRFHDQTLKAPEYLISDLLLGRRDRPYLNISDLTLPLESEKTTYQNEWPGKDIKPLISL